MEGCLEKLSNNKLGINYYQKRHFRLEWSTLKYYARPEDEEAKGSIELGDMHGAYISDEDPQRKTIVLLLGTRSVFLHAPDPEEALAWVHNLRSCRNPSRLSDPIPMPKHIFKALVALIDSCRDNGGCYQEGLFRVPGRSNVIKSICRSAYLNRPMNTSTTEAKDVESTSGAIKRLLRFLPEPLFTAKRSKLIAAADNVDVIRQLIIEMPPDNRIVIHKLFALFAEICKNEESTKMTPFSLAIVFSPCLSGAETGALFDMKVLFTLMIEQLSEIFGSISLSPDVVETKQNDHAATSLSDLQSTPSARAMHELMKLQVGVDGDIKSVLRAKKQSSVNAFTTFREKVSKRQSIPDRFKAPDNDSLDQASVVSGGTVAADSHRPSRASADPSAQELGGHNFISSLFKTNRGSISPLTRPDLKPPTVYISKSMAFAPTHAHQHKQAPVVPVASGKTMIHQEEEAPIPPAVKKQLENLKNRVQELEVRCSYWRTKAEMAQNELAQLRAPGQVVQSPEARIRETTSPDTSTFQIDDASISSQDEMFSSPSVRMVVDRPEEQLPPRKFYPNPISKSMSSASLLSPSAGASSVSSVLKSVGATTAWSYASMSTAMIASALKPKPKVAAVETPPSIPAPAAKSEPVIDMDVFLATRTPIKSDDRGGGGQIQQSSPTRNPEPSEKKFFKKSTSSAVPMVVRLPVSKEPQLPVKILKTSDSSSEMSSTNKKPVSLTVRSIESGQTNDPSDGNDSAEDTEEQVSSIYETAMADQADLSDMESIASDDDDASTLVKGGPVGGQAAPATNMTPST